MSVYSSQERIQVQRERLYVSYFLGSFLTAAAAAPPPPPSGKGRSPENQSGRRIFVVISDIVCTG